MWIASKAMIYVIILGLLLVVFVIKVVPPMVVKYHEKELEMAIAELSDTKALAGELAERANAVTDTIEQKQRELRKLEQERKQLNDWLEKIKNIFRNDEIKAEKRRLEAKMKMLEQEKQSLEGERNQIQIEGGESEEVLKDKELLRDEKERQLREIEEMRSKFDSLMQNELRQMALVALGILAAIIVVPLLWKVLAFYLIAPIAQVSKPILLGADHAVSEQVTATPSHPAQRIILELGEVMMTKVDYLQGTMGDFEKRTKWLIDWQYPFSSLAAGLFILTKIRNKGEVSGQVTLSTQGDATEELAVVTIPLGKSMVFRPHYLVAVTHPDNSPPRIRSKWVFWKLHAWVNLQFRYMIVEGPAKLVFSAQRGIQAEDVLPEHPGRRVNSNLTVAFSPYLNYSPKRAETFVAYVWGKNALFDDFFQGTGCVLQQQVSVGKKNPAARFWDGVLGAVGKVFGI